MKHLNIFSPISEYEKAKADNLLNRPNVSLVDEDKTVRYLIDIDVDPPVIGPPIDNNEYEYVDLGLPSGLKWAKCNIGATSETDYGLYFQWGATEGYTAEQIENGEKVFNFGTTPYQTNESAGTSSSGTKFKKYLGSTSSGYKDPSATDEDAMKTVLDPIDDAATQLMGKDWRMPTTDEYKTLKNETLWVWSPGGKVGVKKTDENGTETIDYVDYPAGYFVYKVKDEADKGNSGTFTKDESGKLVGFTTPSNTVYYPGAHEITEGDVTSIVDGDTHIFFPASGSAYGTGVGGRDSYAGYWSSSLFTIISYQCYNLYFRSGRIIPGNNVERYYGYCVRSVSET